MPTSSLSDRSSVVAGASSAAGAALRGAFTGLGRLRPTAKPLHPRGMVLPATVHRYGSRQRFGVPWLDEPGTDPALVRFSRGGGLPEAWPDVLGIALRVMPDHRPGDLLFATTGRGPVGRFLLVPRRAAVISCTTHSTLQPYRTPTGPVLLSATPAVEGSATVIRLAAARPTGRWEDFGSVVVDPERAPEDRPISFDPFLNAVPGLENYGWTRRIREGAYEAARATRATRRGRPR